MKVERVRSGTGARVYVGQYIGKQRQKQLPACVSGAGRWWGKSRGLQLALVEEVVTSQAKAQDNNRTEVWVTRHARRYLTRRLGWKFRGGFLVDWNGKLCGDLVRVIRECRQWIMDACDRERRHIRPLLDQYGWEPVEGIEFPGEVGRVEEKREFGARLVDLGLDPEQVERARARWEERFRKRNGGRRKRRGMWVDYFPAPDGIGAGSGKPVEPEPRSALQRADEPCFDFGEAEGESERDAA